MLAMPAPQPGRQYLTFDDPGVLAAAKRDPNGFIAGLNTPVTLDEVQHVPELFPVIKVAIDRKREAGRFLLTGSANVMLLPRLSESLAGGMLENFVLMELRKHSAWSETQPEFFYWRTASGQEVDIVLEDSAGRLVGIEIKASVTLGGSDVRGLQAMANAVGKRWICGVVLYTGTEVIPFGANLHGLPLSHLWARG